MITIEQELKIKGSFWGTTPIVKFGDHLIKASQDSLHPSNAINVKLPSISIIGKKSY